MSTPLTSRGTQALFVVNSVKLHLNALKEGHLERLTDISVKLGVFCVRDIMKPELLT